MTLSGFIVPFFSCLASGGFGVWLGKQWFGKEPPPPEPEAPPKPSAQIGVIIDAASGKRLERVCGNEVRYPNSGHLIILENDKVSAIFAPQHWTSMSVFPKVETSKHTGAEFFDKAAPGRIDQNLPAPAVLETPTITLDADPSKIPG